MCVSELEYVTNAKEDDSQELGVVKEADISHETGKALLQVDAPSLFDAWNELPKIMETVDSLGYTAHPCLGDQEE